MLELKIYVNATKSFGSWKERKLVYKIKLYMNVKCKGNCVEVLKNKKIRVKGEYVYE